MKIGDMLYHESRYWAQYPVFDEVPGWNARYLPYVVVRITDRSIYCTGAGVDGKTSRVQFPRHPKHRPGHARPTTLEADGKQYHSRFREYFYREIPAKDSEPFRAFTVGRVPSSRALSLLGLTWPCSAGDIKRAYRRKSKEAHPDTGGSHERFIELKKAFDEVCRAV